MGTGTAGGRKPSIYARRLFHNQSLKAHLLRTAWVAHHPFTKELDLTNNQVLKRIQMSSCCRFEATEICAFGSAAVRIEGAKAVARGHLGN